MASEWYSYCFVRRDLPEPVKIVQAGHAWWEVARMGFPLGYWDNLHECNFVLIGAESEHELVNLHRRLKKLPRGGSRVGNVLSQLFYEPDGGLGFTALATEPLRAAERDFFRGFPLLEAWVPSS